MTSETSTTVLKVVGGAGIMAVGFFRLLYYRDVDNGVWMVCLGLWVAGATKTMIDLKSMTAGLAARADSLDRGQDSIKADLDTIKSSPNEPGVPLGRDQELYPTRHP